MSMGAGAAFAVGLLLIAFAVYGRESQLCDHGHPAKRSPHVTYGGMPPVRGWVRDHVVPLCLGGADTAENIQYQKPRPAAEKDERERQACEAYCAGNLSLSAAKLYVKGE
jgi:hypothetical protein